MSRLLILSKPLKPAEIRRRAAKQRVERTKTFVDPFPAIPGTLPEKMLYAALMARQIPFLYQESVTATIPEIGLNNNYRPDFILPDTKIIIEVQGAYWHSMPDRIESDSFRAAILEYLGYKVLFWWDYDILARLDELFLADPVMANYPVRGNPLPHVAKWHDDSAGIRTLNRKHKKPISYATTRLKMGKRKKSSNPKFQVR